MLCPACKIECRIEGDSEGQAVFICRNPKCGNYNKTVAVVDVKEEEA